MTAGTKVAYDASGDAVRSDTGVPPERRPPREVGGRRAQERRVRGGGSRMLPIPLASNDGPRLNLFRCCRPLASDRRPATGAQTRPTVTSSPSASVGRGGGPLAGRDTLLGRDVAVSSCRGLGPTPPREDSGAKSGHTTARHPNIVAVYDKGEEDGSRHVRSRDGGPPTHDPPDVAACGHRTDNRSVLSRWDRPCGGLAIAT